MKTYKQFLEQQTHQQASLERLKARREAANQEQEDLASSRTLSKPTQSELASEREENFKKGVEERSEILRKKREEEAQKRAEEKKQKEEEN